MSCFYGKGFDWVTGGPMNRCVFQIVFECGWPSPRVPLTFKVSPNPIHCQDTSILVRNDWDHHCALDCVVLLSRSFAKLPRARRSLQHVLSRDAFWSKAQSCVGAQNLLFGDWLQTDLACAVASSFLDA